MRSNKFDALSDLQALTNMRRLPGQLRRPEEDLESRRYLERQAATESNARSYPRKFPFALAQGKGIYLKDVDGNVYYDCLCGAGAIALGHNHAAVQEAIRDQLDANSPLLTLDLTTPLKDAYVHEILGLFPDEFAHHARIQFCGPSGADAVEAAIKLVKYATGRSTMMSFHGAYHGMTHGALSMMGNLGAKQISGLMSDVHFLPYPYRYRPPIGTPDTCDTECIRYIETVLTDDESGVTKPAGVLLEAMQGEGGKIPASPFFLRELRRITEEQNIPLLLDEIQTGLGRTGKMFAFEHAGILPDVVILSKAIGGSQPIALIVYHERLDKWGPGAHAGTFRGNQLAMAAGMATMRYICEHQLVDNAARMGRLFLEKLRQIQKNTHCIGDVRGLGLMIGVEIVNRFSGKLQQGQPERFEKMAHRIQFECFCRGLIVEMGGRQRSVVRFLPPLTITEKQVRHICAIFKEAVNAAEIAVLSDTTA